MLRLLPAIYLLLSTASTGLATPTLDRLFSDSLQPVFEKNCIECHGENGKVKGDLNLLEISTSDDLLRNPERLQDMIDVLEFEDMPPEDEPPLEPSTRNEMINALGQALEVAIEQSNGFPSTPIRRMNRFQYNNAVQDLFELKVDVFALPERMLREYGNYFRPDSNAMPQTLKAGSRPLGKSQLIDKRLAGVVPFPQDLRAEHGFDNQADHLTLSPLLLESFLKLSSSILHSDDFNSKSCGIWDAFFAAPMDSSRIEPAIRERLNRFITKAFRRPARKAQLERYVQHALFRIQEGDTFTDSMKSVASAVIASPHFLYLYDRSTDPSHSDFHLASRLSFFLWGSIPDDELLELAASKELHNPNTLEQQIDRLLTHKKLKRFCDSFPSQWLQLERIISSVPDRDRFPDFYFSKYRASMHMMLEPLLLFETILIEDRPILELIDSDYSYRSTLLDSFYHDHDVSNRKPVTAIPFNRVSLKDRRQGGVITTAAVMTMTSNPNRTQPITRGAWMASVIFNDAPEPPPANVPPLSEDEKTEHLSDLTLRERFEAHRSNPECAGCHVRIDPLGFAFENYGPTGAWRDHYVNGREIDPSGTLFRKHEFHDILDFKDVILNEKDRFTRAFASHLLAFALGRRHSFEDIPSLDRIVEATRADDYRMQTIIKQVILSDSFTHQSIASGVPQLTHHAPSPSTAP